MNASIDPNSCVVCHGGDPEARDKEAAHVPVPANWAEVRGGGLPPSPVGFIRDFAPDQLDALDPEYVRFINPGDIRAMAQSCGPCHEEQVATLRTSVMSTNAGHYYPSLYLVGAQDDQLAHVGSVAETIDDCDPTVLGAVCEVTTLTPATDEEIQAAIDSGDPYAIEEVAYSHYLSKNCNTCHQAGYPRNDSPALYRSTGCSGCHMVYGENGLYEGGDEALPHGTPVHPQRHVLTRAIPTEQCATCHFQGGRIGLAFRGIREGGFNSANTPPNAVAIDRTLYGHTAGYYFTDEDSTNNFDETPPDVHYARGMHCVDCHVGGDVHGTGDLLSSSKWQVGIQCEDCHGTARERAAPSPSGSFVSAKGQELRQLSQEGDNIILTGLVDGARHIVPQPADLLAPGGYGTDAMHEAMGDNADGWAHPDSLTCDTCHTSYNLNCIGCHVSYDLRLDQVGYQTGQVSTGLTRGSRTTYTIDHVLLGTAPDGRVQTVAASQQVQMAVYGSERFGTEDGEVLLGGRIDDGNGGTRVVGAFRARTGHTANNGFVPFFQHTTSSTPRSCDSCHRKYSSPEEELRIRGVYGFGTGEFMLPAPDGSPVDGLAFLDADGNPTSLWVHPGTGPVDPTRRDRAMAVILDALPGR